jgi:hypothetical protein
MSSTKLIGPHKIITYCGSKDIHEFNHAMQDMVTVSDLQWSRIYEQDLKKHCEEKLRNRIAHLWVIYSHPKYGTRDSLWRVQSGSIQLLLADYDDCGNSGAIAHFRPASTYDEIETFVRTQQPPRPPAAPTVHASPPQRQPPMEPTEEMRPLQPLQPPSRNWYDPSNPLTSLRNQLRKTFPCH